MEEIKNILGQIKMRAGELAHGHQGEAAKGHGRSIVAWVEEIENKIKAIPEVKASATEDGITVEPHAEEE